MGDITLAPRSYWLWVTKKDYYFDDNECENPELDPKHWTDSGGWWTCHRDTKRGDFALLYRTLPKSDIGYLLQATSDAFSLSRDKYAVKMGWSYGCEWKPLYKFKNPVTRKEIGEDPYLSEFPAHRGRFQRRVFRIESEYWQMLNDLASTKNSDYGKLLEKLQRKSQLKEVLLEEQIEDYLVDHLECFAQFGMDLELYRDKDSGGSGRQYICGDMRGRIDLLCYDRKRRRYVVIEIKNVKATEKVVGQILKYVGWVKSNLSRRKPVVGLVVSRGCDVNFELAIKSAENIIPIDLKDIGF